jgi:16S rRNA (guanine527-N7)-methyltransferase
LSDLLGFAAVHLRAGGPAIFPKGARHAEELTEARNRWTFDIETRPSQSDRDSAVLVIRNIHRANQD